MDHPFCSAPSAASNRQDVLDYLEKTAAENARKQQELQRRLEEAEEDRRKLASLRSRTREERVTILNRDRESLSQQLEQVKAVLEASREREGGPEPGTGGAAPGAGQPAPPGGGAGARGGSPIPPSRSGPPGWSWRPTAGLRTC